jgi:hypothetical protein
MENIVENKNTAHDREDDAFVYISLDLNDAQKMEYQKMLNGESRIPKKLAVEIDNAMTNVHDDELRARKFLIGRWVKQNIKI